MVVDIYQIDAFTTKRFGGNPAAVCPLNKWLEDDVLLGIAKENNLAETAYFIHDHDNVFKLRWFTPEIEMDLCGHATLASAYVIFNCLEYDLDLIKFQTLSGELIVSKLDNQIEMDFPSRPPIRTELPREIAKALSHQPLDTYKSRDYVLLYSEETDVANLKVNANLLDDINLDPGGIIVTAKGDRSDFVSRFFTPGAAVFEDPVTGSAHCSLIPFWAERLKKTELRAYQISERQGELFCQLDGDRVFIKGSAVLYLQGKIHI